MKAQSLQRQWSPAGCRLPDWCLEMVIGNERNLSSQEVLSEETELQLYPIFNLKKKSSMDKRGVMCEIP